MFRTSQKLTIMFNNETQQYQLHTPDDDLAQFLGSSSNNPVAMNRPVDALHLWQQDYNPALYSHELNSPM